MPLQFSWNVVKRREKLESIFSKLLFDDRFGDALHTIANRQIEKHSKKIELNMFPFSKDLQI